MTERTLTRERIEQIKKVGLDPPFLAAGPSSEDVRILCDMALASLDRPTSPRLEPLFRTLLKGCDGYFVNHPEAAPKLHEAIHKALYENPDETEHPVSPRLEALEWKPIETALCPKLDALERPTSLDDSLFSIDDREAAAQLWNRVVEWESYADTLEAKLKERTCK